MANSPRLAELADLITRREYNYALCKARKHEEELVHHYVEDNDMDFTTLAETIEDLYQAGVINDVSRENLHGIRILGNKAVHEGDNDPQDAKQSYEMLKKELDAYADKKYTNPVRTPVAVRKHADVEEYGVRRRRRDEEEEEIDVSYAQKNTRNENSERGEKKNSSRGQKKKSSEGVSLYTILKIVIPVMIIVLLVVLVKSIFSGSAPEETLEETTAAEVETSEEMTTEEAATTEEAVTTEEPTTEAAASYQIKGEGVRVRLASDPTQVYTLLDTGTFIGQVTDYENTTGDSTFDGFARFTYDGKDVIVSKKFIEKTSQ